MRLSLAPAFRRRWPSLFDALTDGTVDLAALRRLWVVSLPPPTDGQRLLWAIDGSTWPRPEAKTSPDRTCCRFVTAGIPESGIMPGWEYQTRLSPGRVRRVMPGLLATLGTPARSPQPRGKAPGRRVGDRPGRAPHYPTQRRAPPRPAFAP